MRKGGQDAAPADFVGRFTQAPPEITPMVRSFILGLFVVAATAGLSANCDAGMISKNNPYRSFNISGINYGSQNWERTHGNRSSSRNFRSSGSYFRGR